MRARKKRESMRIVPPGKKKCVWMEAGVVSYKLCDNNYDCNTCAYDHGMQVKVDRQKESVVAKPVTAFPERFTEIRAQKMMQDRLSVETLPVYTKSHAAGFELAEDFYYHEGHTWAKTEYGGFIRVGLDDFIQKLIGGLGKIELPNIGQHIKQGEVGFKIRHNGEIAKVLSPMDGIVVHVNDRLADQPELVNESPYEKGWLFIIEPIRLRENLIGLYYGRESRDYLFKEKEKLFSMANDELKVAADGGVVVENISLELKGKKWAKFVKTFLKT
jgi:glycine cleavage system H lipoate-binding protein